MTGRLPERDSEKDRDEDARRVADRLRSKETQVRARGGSQLYAHLLERTARDAEAGGPSLEVLRGFAGEPRGSALALRFLSAVHRLVLDGRAPELARHYPSVGGSAGPHGAWPPFRAVLAETSAVLREAIAVPCQTNEVGRSAALLPAFLAVAREHGLPLRILELGSSGGLNLNWDRYRYEGEGWSWGPQESPARHTAAFEGRPALDGHTAVVERGRQLDDGQGFTTDRAEARAGLNRFVNGESIYDADVVLWYAAHFSHDVHDEGAGEHGHVVGPELVPSKL